VLLLLLLLLLRLRGRSGNLRRGIWGAGGRSLGSHEEGFQAVADSCCR